MDLMINGISSLTLAKNKTDVFTKPQDIKLMDLQGNPNNSLYNDAAASFILSPRDKQTTVIPRGPNPLAGGETANINIERRRF
jgi:hypothetical protein